MGSILKTTSNTRPILSGSIRYVRSDVPDRLTAEEREWLFRQNITTVVDLRTEPERHRRPCPLEQDGRFRYYIMPVKGGGRIPASPEAVAGSYIAMADEKMEEIIRLIRDSDTNVLYFCNAGKDRTGVVSAILLYRDGLDREYILEDYMRSKENLMPMLVAYGKQKPDLDLRIITPQRRYMEEFLDWYEDKRKTHP